MKSQEINQSVEALLGSYRSGQAIAPLSTRFSNLTLTDAYEIQLGQVVRWRLTGRTIRGHKVGLTSKAMQEQLKVNQPDYGHLFDDMFYSESEKIPVNNFISPRIEPEFGFILSRPLYGPNVTAEQAASCIGEVVASLEIIDSRIENWKITITDTIADNASSAGVVLGKKSLKPNEIDLVNSNCVLSKNGEVVGEGLGSAVLGSPINALVWLANKLHELGTHLEAGEIVLPGSVCASIPVEAGDTISADFGALGVVTANFM